MGTAPRVRHGAAGFTLIELIVVLVLVSFMLALVPPMFSGAIGSVSLKRDARDIVSAARHLRSVAIAKQRPQTLEVDVSTRRWNAGPGRGGQLPESVTMTLTTARSEMSSEDAGRIRFFPDGGATGGQVILSRDGHRLTIDVNWVTGQVTLYQSSGDEA